MNYNTPELDPTTLVAPLTMVQLKQIVEQLRPLAHYVFASPDAPTDEFYKWGLWLNRDTGQILWYPDPVAGSPAEVKVSALYAANSILSSYLNVPNGTADRSVMASQGGIASFRTLKDLLSAGDLSWSQIRPITSALETFPRFNGNGATPDYITYNDLKTRIVAAVPNPITTHSIYQDKLTWNNALYALATWDGPNTVWTAVVGNNDTITPGNETADLLVGGTTYLFLKFSTLSGLTSRTVTIKLNGSSTHTLKTADGTTVLESMITTGRIYQVIMRTDGATLQLLDNSVVRDTLRINRKTITFAAPAWNSTPAAQAHTVTLSKVTNVFSYLKANQTDGTYGAGDIVPVSSLVGLNLYPAIGVELKGSNVNVFLSSAISAKKQGDTVTVLASTKWDLVVEISYTD
jgi:hypothetical protein